MTVNSQLTEKGLGATIAEKYRFQGFEVFTQPPNSLIPFDLAYKRKPRTLFVYKNE